MSELIALSGSIRGGSLNEKLALLAVKYAQSQGVDAEYIDLRNYSLPIYNGDIDNSHDKPKPVLSLKKIFVDSSKIIIASPENNASVSPLLKNVIDWVSRSDEGELPFAYPAFRSKAVALLSASPGKFAGIRGLNHLKDILNSVFAIVVPEHLCIAQAHKAFDSAGNLVNASYQEMLEKVINSLLRVPKLDE